MGDGSHLGLQISYKIQPSPDGLAQAFILGDEFIANDSVCLVLGDNIFYGHGFGKVLTESAQLKDGAIVFGYYVRDPERYGVVEFDEKWNALSLEEKPKDPKSNYAVVGLYFYGNDVVNKAKNLKPSPRGELEITDLNRLYLDEKRLKVQLLGRGHAWLDTGTHDSLLEASNFIQTVEKRQGLKVSCVEEIAYVKGFINKEQLLATANTMKNNEYGKYLIDLANDKISTINK